MAASLIQQLYSQNHWADIDGVQTIWNFTFAGPESGSYILPAHVKAYYEDAEGERYAVTITEDMFIGPYQLQIIPAIPASATRFVIYRDTPKDMPLVDFEGGATVTEANLDRAAKQCIFAVAELVDTLGIVLVTGGDGGDATDHSEFGFKALKQNAFTGASVVLVSDNGKAHTKTDATDVEVPNTLPIEFLCSILNNSDSEMSVTFTAGVAYLQGGTGSVTELTLAARSVLSLSKVSDGVWFASGNAE